MRRGSAGLGIPRLANPANRSGRNALREAAKIGSAAEAPVILRIAYARFASAMDDLVRLAELLQAPVFDTVRA